MARPSKYNDSMVVDAEAHARLGATDAELAEHFGISASTLYEWKNEYPELAEAIKRGKRPADTEVATALFNRAKGAEWVEEQAIKLKRVEYDGQTGRKVKEEEYVEVVEVTRRAPADTTAGIFWLKNRQPERWRDAARAPGDSPDNPLHTETRTADPRPVGEIVSRFRAASMAKPNGNGAVKH